MTNPIIKHSSIEMPEYKLVLVAEGNDRVIGKMNLDREGNLDMSTMYETMNVIHTMIMTDKGLMQFLTFNVEGTMIYIPETAKITILDRQAQYYKEYLKMTSGIVEPDRSIKLH